MRAPAKVGIVVGGYAAALAVAGATVAMYVALTNGPDRQASSGMHAFGDGLLFLAVFAVAAVPASGAGLYFLRPHSAFWRVVSAVAITAGVTGIGAAGIYLTAQARMASAGSILHVWSGAAVLRILVGPLIVLWLLLAGVLAPTRSSRILLLMGAAAEAAAFGAVALSWLTQIVR